MSIIQQLTSLVKAIFIISYLLPHTVLLASKSGIDFR